jgi:hypothetical protein
VHVYNVLAMALGTTPSPNDGDPEIARQLLREVIDPPDAPGPRSARLSVLSPAPTENQRQP